METVTSVSPLSLTSNAMTTVPPAPSIVIAALYTTVVCVLIIVGTLGNILVLLSVWFFSRLQNWANALIVNLSIADLLVSMITMPTLLVRSFNQDVMQSSPQLCAFIFELNLTVVIVSITTLGVSAVNRYILITKPRYVYRQYFGRNNIIIVLVMIWAISAAVVFIPTIALDLIEYVPFNEFCHFREGNKLAWWYGTVILLVYIVGVMTIIMISSILTFYKIVGARNRVQMVIERSQGSQSQDVAPSARNVLTRQESLVTRMMMIVFIAFCLCMLPYCINHAMSYHGYRHKGFLRASILLSLANSCINPVIYAGSNRYFRASFKKILTCQCMKP